jgi:hypothetical protein
MREPKGAPGAGAEGWAGRDEGRKGGAGLLRSPVSGSPVWPHAPPPSPCLPCAVQRQGGGAGGRQRQAGGRGGARGGAARAGGGRGGEHDAAAGGHGPLGWQRRGGAGRGGWGREKARGSRTPPHVRQAMLSRARPQTALNELQSSNAVLAERFEALEANLRARGEQVSGAGLGNGVCVTASMGVASARARAGIGLVWAGADAARVGSEGWSPEGVRGAGSTLTCVVQGQPLRAWCRVNPYVRGAGSTLSGRNPDSSCGLSGGCVRVCFGVAAQASKAEARLGEAERALGESLNQAAGLQEQLAANTQARRGALHLCEGAVLGDFAQPVNAHFRGGGGPEEAHKGAGQWGGGALCRPPVGQRACSGPGLVAGLAGAAAGCSTPVEAADAGAGAPPSPCADAGGHGGGAVGGAGGGGVAAAGGADAQRAAGGGAGEVPPVRAPWLAPWLRRRPGSRSAESVLSGVAPWWCRERLAAQQGRLPQLPQLVRPLCDGPFLPGRGHEAEQGGGDADGTDRRAPRAGGRHHCPSCAPPTCHQAAALASNPRSQLPPCVPTPSHAQNSLPPCRLASRRSSSCPQRTTRRCASCRTRCAARMTSCGSCAGSWPRRRRTRRRRRRAAAPAGRCAAMAAGRKEGRREGVGA